MDITTTLNERAKTHGDFTRNSATSQGIKSIMRVADNWGTLHAHQQEALEMVAHKIGRILSGNSDEPDHWRDIAGYATLVEKCLAETKRQDNFLKIPVDETKPWPVNPTPSVGKWPNPYWNFPTLDPADIYKGPTCDLQREEDPQQRAAEEALNRCDGVLAIKEYL